MGLADTIYTILNTGWEVGVIAKPVFYTDEKSDPNMRDCIINSDEAGTFTPSSHDGSDDFRTQDWSILGMEGSDGDCYKMIKQIKKHLKSASSVSNGTFIFERYAISGTDQQKTYVISGSNKKLINYDEF